MASSGPYWVEQLVRILEAPVPNRRFRERERALAQIVRGQLRQGAGPAGCSSLDGLSSLSIAKAQKSVENLSSWEDALAHAKRRIKELRQSARIFEQKIKNGTPWPPAE